MSIIKYQKGDSYWMASSKNAHAGYPKLEGDIEVDVAIVGGGIAGLSSAYFLKQAGLTVAIIEQEVIGGGTTGFTTGKVTSQHNLIYAELKRRFGTAKARAYGEANQAAVEKVREVVAAEKIDCDWRDEDNYVFTEDVGEVSKLKREAEVAKSLDLPAEFLTETPLPFPVRGAVRFKGQGTFHARKYVLGLAKTVDGGGSHVFEHTKALFVTDGEPATVKTAGGAVRAKHVIIATLVPFSIPAHTAYSLVEYPLTSYIVAFPAKEALEGMYISSGESTYSILPVTSGEDNLILVGGQGHIPGTGRAKKHYEKLIDFGRERFGVEPTKYRWQAWDYLTYDHVPAIGKLYPWSRNVYTATGFMKWGLSNGTAAGMILRDLITGKKNAWAETFDSTRGSTIASIPRFIAKLPKLIG